MSEQEEHQNCKQNQVLVHIQGSKSCANVANANAFYFSVTSKEMDKSLVMLFANVSDFTACF